MKFLLLVVFLLHSGCISNRPNEQSFGEVEFTMNSYKNCMEYAAADYYRMPASTDEIATAAQSKCSEHYNEYEQATIKYFTSGVSQDFFYRAKYQAELRVLKTKQSLQEGIVRLVLEKRAER